METQSTYAAERATTTEAPTDETLIAWVKEHGPARLAAIAAAFGIPVPAAPWWIQAPEHKALCRQLQRLRKQGQRRPVGAVLRSGNDQRWRVVEL